MTDREMELCLYDLLCGVSAADLEDANVDIPDDVADIDRVSTYPEVGMLTDNAGLEAGGLEPRLQPADPRGARAAGARRAMRVQGYPP